MCGIVGKVFKDSGNSVEPGLIGAMKRCMVHRGPDEEGAHLRAPVGLGFQRLAIIDLKSGQQPMGNEDGQVVIVFNGEVYNFQGLRDELVAAGHTFRTHSDTETILHGYEEWGPAVVRRLRGMFAFAIYDHRKNSLFIARDRVGKKPLYYTVIDEGGPNEALLFASEMKSLLAEPAVGRQLDPVALSHYLTYQYVPAPRSIFRGIKKLPPAHTLYYAGGRCTLERYWQLDYEPKRQITFEQAREETFDRLDEATRIRLMSEVPLGCFLSGGIDSSAVVAMMRRHIPGRLRTFSIGFNEAAFNELPYARQVAEKFETDHEEFVVEPNALECLGALAWHFDEPFADSSAIPTYYLARMTRRHVTVALNGDGGDESFAGYERYRGFRAFNRWQRIPRALRAAAQPAFAAAASALSHSAKAELLSYVNRSSLSTDERLYIQTMVIFRDYQKHAVLSPAMRAAALAAEGEAGAEADSEALTERIMQNGRALSPVDKRMYSDIEMYLPGALLPKVDRMTMANSLEGRSPFLDQELMQFAASLPAELKFGPGQHLKHLLKHALAPKVFTMEFLDRPKQGFGVPIGGWFRQELRELTYEFLLGERARARGLFDMEYVGRMVRQHMEGRQNHHHRLWTLMMFEAWARTFLDRAELDGPLTFG